VGIMSIEFPKKHEERKEYTHSTGIFIAGNKIREMCHEEDLESEYIY